MSVIWSGITEQGAIVPVQVDETGKVVSTASVPDQYVLRSGDTMSGPLVLPGDPQNATEAATKQYVDSTLSSNGPIAYGYYGLGDILIGSYNIALARYQGVGNYLFYFDNIPPSTNYVVVATAQYANTQVVWTGREFQTFQLNSVSTVSPYAAIDTPVSFVVYWSPNNAKVLKSE